MKYLILFFAFLFPTVSLAQDAPTLFDEWSPALAGTLAHFQISKDEITITFPSHFGALATIMTLPAPVTAPPNIVVKNDPVVAKTEKVKLLKVIYDSAQSKGRLFVRVDKIDSMILPLSFLLKDNGEAEIGLAADPFSLFTGKGNMKSLKEVEKATRPGAKNKKSRTNDVAAFFKHGFDGFDKFTFTFYNSSRTAEFAKLKDPTTMPKEEVIPMINSFGDRLAAELQKLPQDSAASTNPFAMFSYFVPLFKNVQRVSNDLFIAHGYNPLGAASCMDKFKDDSDVIAAGKLLGEKVEQSVPALREEKRRKDSSIEARKNEELIPYGNDAEGIAEARKLMDLKSPLYDATGTLTKEQSDNLLQKIASHKASDLEISVVIVSSLHSNTAEHAAHMVGEWNKIPKTTPSGAVIFLAKDDRKGYIASRGMLEYVPDSTIQTIFDNVLTPALKQGNYYEGIDKTIDAVAEQTHDGKEAFQKNISQWQLPGKAEDSIMAPPPPPPPATDESPKNEENINAQIGQLNNVYRQRLVSNFIEDLKGLKEIDHSVLNKLTNARVNAVALWLTPKIAKDSLAFDKFQKAQDDLSQAISDLLVAIEKNPNLRKNEKIVTLLSQLEGQENRIHVERQRYNEMLANTKYYSFTAKYGEAPIVKFDDSTNSK